MKDVPRARTSAQNAARRAVRMSRRGFVAMGVICVIALCALPAAAADLTQDLVRIFNTPELSTRGFGPAQWLDDGAGYLTVEPSETNKAWRDIVRYDAATGKREVLIAAATSLKPAGATEPLRVEQYAFSPDKSHVLIFTNSKKVWRQNTRGDYWVLDRGTMSGSAPAPASASASRSGSGSGPGSLRKLGGDAPPSSLMFAKFSPDGRRVAYVRDHNLYVEDVAAIGAVTPLTSDGSATIINGTSDWVYEEELDVRDGFRWSPDSTRIAFWRFDSTGVGAYALVDNAAGVYPAVTMIPYPKVGTTNSAAKIGVVSATGGPTQWMEVPGDPREHYIARMDWAANSSELMLQQLNRLQNRNDLLLAEAHTGHVRQILREQDDAWVDVDDDFYWLNGGAKFLWLSERDGWRRLYTVTRDGATLTPLTSPSTDVVRVVAVDPTGDWVYYLAAPTNATQRQLLRVRTNGTGNPELLTPAPTSTPASASTPAIARGTNAYQISTDARWAFHTYSTFDQPPIVELIRLPSHQTVRVLEDNAAVRANAAPFLATQADFFTVDIDEAAEGASRDQSNHGNQNNQNNHSEHSEHSEHVTLDGWMLRPPDFDPAKRYPVLVYVYGEPAGVTVTDSWGGKRELFHRALARDGFIVVSFDNRGTPAPKGRAWRKVVYGDVGVLSAQEQAAAIRTFASTRPYIDTSRMAIWGWSGGGSNTLNVMFRSPGLFQVGVSVAPVPDQRLYDTIYQERYMGLPTDNADGYHNGSPINFAERLQGRLLLIHGSGDDNVHIQGSERLVNRLIELGKPFDYFVYPGRSHSIDEGPGTSFHIYSQIARYLKEHLLVPRPPLSSPDAASR
jgi:dipeptidyl-peptidase-4